MAVKLNPKQRRFVEEYLVDLNATAAAKRAGYSERTARQAGAENLSKPVIKAAIQEAIKERSEQTGITAAEVLRHWQELARADPNELVEYRRFACRYCHGQGHRYQFTPAEHEQREKAWRIETAKAERENKDPPPPLDPEGGVGYDRRKPPHPDCPECFGDGHEQAHVKDTRNLSEQAKLLYAGVKQTKDGIEVKMHDQAAARANVAKHLGMFKDVVEHKGDPANPVKHEHTVSHRIEAYAAAFESAAHREEEGAASGDGVRQPIHPGEDQSGDDVAAG
jgi:phage terminase small subunit